MAIDNKVISDFVGAVKQEKTTKNNVYQATVSRIDKDGTVWVNLPGSDDETPTASTSAEVKRGDVVNVEWRNNKLYVGGNYSNPAAGLERVGNVEAVAEIARAQAARANEAAIEAEGSAATAKMAAGEAALAAEGAQGSAESAQSSAIVALNQLDIIENVVGVLDLLAKNGTYQTTSDATVQNNKWYFTRTGTSPDYVYQVVSNPSGDPSAEGWYELTGVDQAVQNYVSSHLVLDNNGLWLQTDTSNAKLFLSSTDGVVLYGTGGTPVAKYGTDTIIGDENEFHIQIGGANSDNEIGFYQGTNRVAYMNGSELYVKNSLSFGNFIFYQRDNGHFTLKRID